MGRTYKRTPKRAANSCRNHGSCPWCRGNRTHQHTKAKQAMPINRAYWSKPLNNTEED